LYTKPAYERYENGTVKGEISLFDLDHFVAAEGVELGLDESYVVSMEPSSNVNYNVWFDESVVPEEPGNYKLECLFHFVSQIPAYFAVKNVDVIFAVV
ncbi:MAG: hypothetical protein ABIB41_01360, partial [Nitrospirota bacterium]